MATGKFGKGTVVPVIGDDLEARQAQTQTPQVPQERSCATWVKQHPVAASLVIGLTTIILCAAVVVPVTVCSIRGCPPSKNEQPTVNPLYDGAPLRLVLSFLGDVDVDVADLVPPLLQQYTARLRMELSNLQVLEAADMDVLQAVEDAIKERTDLDLEFLVRDFVLRAPQDLDSVVEVASTRRRAQAMALNDPGLGQAYWFNKINVTGAWRLLSLSNDLNKKTSDVVIAVTDSGAQVDHPDLKVSWWVNPGETDDGRDNDKNVFVDDIYGACFSTKQCSPYYATTYNYSLCGIGPKTFATNGITDRTTHGTKIAGVIGAAANNSQGIAGVAPNLRQMILKVTDETFSQFSPPYAYSDVVRAVDYGYGKGARIFSMSFGNDARNGMTPGNKPSLDAAARAYTTLFNKYKDALFVAAAGNEWTNLDDWRRNGYTYSPCMVGTSNVLCVGATDSQDRIFYMYAGNRDQGTNWGPAVVDVGAPGADIYTTSTGSSYASVSGTSFATPMTAAVAGLVLAALGGQGRTSADTPTQIKNILTSSGDPYVGHNGASFISMRRLNAARAVEAALVLAKTNRTVVKRLRTLTAVASSWSSQAFEYTVYADTRNDGQFDPFNMTLYDYYVRTPAPTNQQSTFNVWRYTTVPLNGANRNSLQQISCLLKVDRPGSYSVMASTRGVTANKWQLVIGENTIVWRSGNPANFNTTNAVNFTSDLTFPDAGWYSLTLWVYPTATTDIRLLWTTPINSQWSYPTNFFWTVNDDKPTSRSYDPNAGPRPPLRRPALWHVVWNETTNWGQFSTSNRPYFHFNNDPSRYTGNQATVSSFTWANTVELRNTLYGNTNNFPSIVYGYARANLRPAVYPKPMAFRLQGPSTRLYINGHLVFDFQSESQLMVVTPCVQLQNSVDHEIFLYFATRLNGTNPIGIQWTQCSDPAVAPGGLVGNYTSLTPSLLTNFWWQPASVAGLPRGMRCDAWAAPQSVITNAPAPAFNTTPPTLSWMYPRDCHPDWRTGNGECRVATRLSELFPQLSWNMWTARCWTYWSSSLMGGQSRINFLGGAAYQHMAGRQVYEQNGDGVTYKLSAPRRTVFNVPDAARRTTGVYQLYTVEWIALGSFWNLVSRLQVMDGTVLTNVTAMTLTTNNATMVLPPSAVVPLTFNQPTKEAYSIP